jgi:hypothetical protein
MAAERCLSSQRCVHRESARELELCMDDKQLMLLEEFKALRAEMLGTINDRVWGVVSFIAIFGGVSILSAQTRNPTINILLVYSAVALLLHTASRERARIRIGAYIKTVIEPQLLGKGWETYLATWRDIAPGRTRFSQWLDRNRHVFSLTGIYDIAVAYSLFATIPSSKSRSAYVMEGFGVILFVLSHVYLNRIYSGAKKYETIFLKAKDEFASEQTDKETAQPTRAPTPRT